MRKILKWPVPVDDNDHPIGAGAVVHVDVQGLDTRVIWVWTDELDIEDGINLRRARVYGTGHDLPKNDYHVGSVVIEPFVWHVLAGREQKPQQ